MDQPLGRARADEARLRAYLDRIAAVLGHAGRASAMRAYCAGLLAPGRRKNIEAMAARSGTDRVRALHQSMHHVVAKAAWEDEAVLDAVRQFVLPVIERRGPLRHWIVESVVLRKQGRCSVGVARQSCDGLHKGENCQVAVSLWVANERASLPIAYRLRLPMGWTDNSERCGGAGVPEGAGSETGPAIALRQIRRARADGVPPAVVLGGTEYGADACFRFGVAGLGLSYVLEVPPPTLLWLSVPCPASGQRPPPAQHRGDPGDGPVSAEALAPRLPPRAWRLAVPREGNRSRHSSHFAAVRVRLARPGADVARHPEEWLLLERSGDRAELTGCWLSNLPPHTVTGVMARAARARWRIEHDLRELLRDVGLGHYEGRGWRGFHHHASLCIAAYGFLVAERRSSAVPRSGFGGTTAPEEGLALRPRGSRGAAQTKHNAPQGHVPMPVDAMRSGPSPRKPVEIS